MVLVTTPEVLIGLAGPNRSSSIAGPLRHRKAHLRLAAVLGHRLPFVGLCRLPPVATLITMWLACKLAELSFPPHSTRERT